MSAQPQTKYNEIIRDINTLVTSGADDVSIARLKRDADALVKVDAAFGYMALGALSSLQNDAEGVKHWHDKSIRLLQGDADASYNYAVSLQRVGLNADSSQYAEIAVNLGAHQDHYVKLLLETMVGGGKFMRAMSHFGRAISLPDDFKSLSGIIELMKECGFTDDDFVPIAKQAEEVALEFESPFRTVELGAFRDEVISLNLPVLVSDPHKLADMNEALADRIAAIDARPGVISGFVITFVAIDPVE